MPLQLAVFHTLLARWSECHTTHGQGPSVMTRSARGTNSEVTTRSSLEPGISSVDDASMF